MASTDFTSPDFSADAVIADIRAKNAEREANKAAQEAFGGRRGAETPSAAPAVQTSPVEGNAVARRFMANLPRNVGVGLLDAAINTADAIGLTKPGAANDQQSKVTGAGGTPIPAVELKPIVPVEATAAIQGFRDHLAANSDTADEITQGVAQFAIPYMGFAKLFGVARGAGFVHNLFALGAADIATSTTVLDPHAGRMADLVQLGKHTEGKLGAALNTIAPDGSLQSKYIDWMTARDGETEMEGRFKNAVDTVVTNAAVAGVLKAGATTFRAARTIAQNAPEVIGTGPAAGTPAAQAGKINFTAPEVRPLGNLASERVSGSVLNDRVVLPGSTVIRAQDGGKDVGFISVRPTEDGGAIQINQTRVADEAQGQGAGKGLLLQALDYADAQGKPLVSDTTVTAAQLRVYDSLQKAGAIKVEYSNPEAVAEALAAKDQRTVVKGKGGGPVVTKIERVQPTAPAKMEIREANGGFAVYADGKPIIAYKTRERAQAAIDSLKGE